MAKLSSKQLNTKLTGSFTFSGSSHSFIGNITADNNISASATSTGSFGRLEVAGVVNASGNVRGSRFEIDGATEYIDTSLGNLFIVTTGDIAAQPGTGKALKVTGGIEATSHITASGDVYVSGDVNTGTVIASDTSLVTNGGLQGYRVSSDTSATNRGIFLANADIDDLFLGAGDYWLRWSLTGSDSFSGPWVPVVSDARTGNAQQSIAGGLFDTLTDSGNQLTVELPFSVNGSATTNEVSSPSVLAIFGLGLLSLAGARRRRKAA